MNVLLLHGWGGSDFPHWQSHLAAEIAKEYGAVNFLKLPNFDFPVLEEWIQAATKALYECHVDIVVCHSLGNTLWFHLCNRALIQRNVHALFLVAPPRLDCEIEELQTFFPVEVPTNLYSEKTKLIVSDNDPYLSLEEANMLQKKLQVEMKTLHDAGHINTQSGYGNWPYIYDEIRRCKQ